MATEESFNVDAKSLYVKVIKGDMVTENKASSDIFKDVKWDTLGWKSEHNSSIAGIEHMAMYRGDFGMYSMKGEVRGVDECKEFISNLHSNLCKSGPITRIFLPLSHIGEMARDMFVEQQDGKVYVLISRVDFDVLNHVINLVVVDAKMAVMSVIEGVKCSLFGTAANGETDLLVEIAKTQAAPLLNLLKDSE